MSNDTERQFQEAEAAVEQAIAAFRSKIKSVMPGKWEAVAPAYLRARLLVGLCKEMAKLIDDPDLGIGPAELKLSNALADYRDARAGDRTAALRPWP
jgi:hypothetical protein